MMCARSVIRSSKALHRRALGIIWVHSENGRLVVTITAAFSARPAMTWNRRLRAPNRGARQDEVRGNEFNQSLDHRDLDQDFDLRYLPTSGQPVASFSGATDEAFVD